MKEFFKMTLACIVGVILAGLIGMFFFFGIIGSLAGGSSGKPVLPREGVLDVDMSKFILGEQNQEAGIPYFRSLNTQSYPTVGILEAAKAIDIAAEDPSVKYLLLRSDAMMSGMAQLEEFRASLLKFRAGGKAVVAYTEQPGNGSYFLDSAADKIYMLKDHGGQSMLLGISSRMTFLKDLLDKFGVNVQLIRHGKYKSAGEMFIRNSPSPENLEQYQAMIDAIWKKFSGDMAEGRGISVEKLNSLIDNLSLLHPEDFLAEGLVDSLFTHEQLVMKLAELSGAAKPEDLKLIPFVDYVKSKVPAAIPGKNNVAVIYADGNIVDGKEAQEVAGDRFASIIDKIRRDETVKAVVLRVNSPGGSVLASNKIKDALDLLKEQKPLVASYGNYAASGGYWISNNCGKIYSDATTLTGSIGVFSMIPDLGKTAKDIAHVGITSVGSNKHSDMFSLMRPFNKEELDYMQASIEDIYSSFVSIVAQGRGLTEAKVDEIAQGRVWAGSDAIGIGLVDEIGTLQDAVAYAASLAGFEDPKAYAVVGYPKAKTTMETVMEMFGQKSPDEPAILAGTAFEFMEQGIREIMSNKAGKAYARLPFDIEIR